MKSKFQLSILFCAIAITAFKPKEDQGLFKTIGDDAPSLRIKKWLKGTPVKNFESGKIYVIEFWATWCRPCKAAMPHLSVLAHQYSDKVTFCAIDIYEQKNTTLEIVKNVVKNMGSQMDFSVAVQDSDFMAHDWVDATGEKSIPTTFVINKEGKIAWIGPPNNLNKVLPLIVSNTWDIDKALSKRISDANWATLDTAAVFSLNKYFMRNYDKRLGFGKPDLDSALIAIDKIVEKNPKLKYAPWMASQTFSTLLQTAPHIAYEYGKKVMVTSTYTTPAYSMIIHGIKNNSAKIKISAEIYHLGAECYQAEIDNSVYPELDDIPEKYIKMAAWYELAGDKLKAATARLKAIKLRQAVQK